MKPSTDSATFSIINLYTADIYWKIATYSAGYSVYDAGLVVSFSPAHGTVAVRSSSDSTSGYTDVTLTVQPRLLKSSFASYMANVQISVYKSYTSLTNGGQPDGSSIVSLSVNVIGEATTLSTYKLPEKLTAGKVIAVSVTAIDESGQAITHNFPTQLLYLLYTKTGCQTCRAVKCELMTTGFGIYTTLTSCTTLSMYGGDAIVSLVFDQDSSPADIELVSFVYSTSNNNPVLCPDITEATGEGSFCECPVGYFFDVLKEVCLACTANYYCSKKGLTLRSLDGPDLKCPDLTKSLSGSDSLADCTCYDGFTMTDVTRRVCKCPVGKYLEYSQKGDPTCASCPVGKYNTKIGETSISACASCPLYATTEQTGSDASGDCYCEVDSSINRLFEQDPTPTRPGELQCQCTEGHYLVIGGTGEISTCELCPAGTYGNEMRTCDSCPDYATSEKGSVSDILDCYCKEGFERSPAFPDTVKCQCEEGTYLYLDSGGGGGSVPGAVAISTCQPCQAGKYGNEMRTCDNCPEYATSEKGSVDKAEDCYCIEGFQLDPDNVNFLCRCPIGKYRLDVDVVSSCVSCPEATYGDMPGLVGESDCTSCTNYANATAGSIGIHNCTCVDTFARVEDELSESLCMCPAGSYLVPEDVLEGTSAYCAACLADSYLTSSNVDTSCVLCTMLDENTYTKDVEGSVSEKSCSCKPENMNKTEGIRIGRDICGCLPGYWFDDRSDPRDCTLCDANYFKEGTTLETACKACSGVVDRFSRTESVAEDTRTSPFDCVCDTDLG